MLRAGEQGGILKRIICGNCNHAMNHSHAGMLEMIEQQERIGTEE